MLPTVLTFEFKGKSDSNTIATGVRILFERGFGELAVLIAFTSRDDSSGPGRYGEA
jgi:hypothetical protein